MGWFDIIWLIVAGACSTLGLVHGLVWWRRRDAILNGTFALVALSAAALSLVEQRLLHSTAVDEYLFWLHIYLVPVLLLLVALTLFTRQYLSTARHWIGWTAVGLRILHLILLQFSATTDAYIKVSAIESREFFGQTLAVVIGQPGPLAFLGQASLAMFACYIADSALRGWFRGVRQRAQLIAAFAVLLVVGGLWSHFTLWRGVGLPFGVMPIFVPIVFMLGADLSANLVRARELETRLRESERQLSVAAEAARAGLWNIDGESGRVWCTARARDMFQLPSTQDARFADATKIVHPNDRRRFRRMFIDDGGHAKTVADVEFRVVLGGVVRWYSSHGQRIPHESGRGEGYWGATIDITDRKRADEERLRRAQQLERLGRLAMMGELAAAVAHEMNQPLASMLSNAETALLLLSRESPDLAEVRAVLAEIVAADERAAAIVRRFRGHLRHGEPALGPLELRDAIGGVLGFMRGEFQRRGVRVGWQPDATRHVAACDPVRFDQVVINLVVNACDAMAANAPDDRLLTITLERDGAFEVVRVADVGPGLAENLDTLVEPFFTTKADGLGLGLAIARSIVEAHGGRLWATAGETRGAAFAFSIPVFEATAS